MKKFLFVILLISIVIYSCDKEVQTSPLTIDMASEGTIKGYVLADIDLTKYGQEPAPAGTKVLLSVSYNEYGLKNKGSYQDSAKLDNNGQFQVKIPANAAGVTVNVTPVDFLFDQVQEFNSSNPTLKCLFSCSPSLVTLKSGEVSINTFIYGWDSFSYQTVTLSGKMQGEFDESLAGLENVPAGKSITFLCDGWSKTITTASDGTYSIAVPYGESIYLFYDFTANKNVRSGTTYVVRTYRYYTSLSGSYQGTYYSNQANYNLSVGGGILVP